MNLTKLNPHYRRMIKRNFQRLRYHIDYPFANFEHDIIHLTLLKAFLEQFFKLNCDPGVWRPIDWSWSSNDGIIMVNDLNNQAVRIVIRVNDYNGLLYQPHDKKDHEKYFLPFDCWLENICDSYGEQKYAGLTVSTDMSEKALEFLSKAIKVYTTMANPEKRFSK